jgi:hypothetical protein
MRADRIAWWASLALIMAMLLLPLFLAGVPPLLDHLNHLARMSVLRHLPDDPVLAQMYEATWRILPNVGRDFLVPHHYRSGEEVLPYHVPSPCWTLSKPWAPPSHVLKHPVEQWSGNHHELCSYPAIS